MSEVFSQRFFERLRRATGRGDDALIAARSVAGSPTVTAPCSAQNSEIEIQIEKSLDERKTSTQLVLADARDLAASALGDNSGESAPGVPATASSPNDTATRETTKRIDSPPSWWWARFVGVRDSNCVSLQDAERCVQLVVAELCGGRPAPELSYQFQGDSVSVCEVYQAIGKLTGNPHGWTTVLELMLRARKREGIQPNRGVPVLSRSNVNQASAPWFEEGSGMRRQLADDGAWCG